MDISIGGLINGYKYLIYILSVVIFEYFKIPEHQFTILGILMVIDFLAGISKQAVLDYKSITYHKAWIGILKKVWTLISIIVISLVLSGYSEGISYEKYLIGFLSVLILSEGFSILQKIYTIRTGKETYSKDYISILIKKIGDVFGGVIERTLNIKKEKKENPFDNPDIFK